MKTHVYTKACTQMFTATHESTLMTLSRCIVKQTYIHRVEYYSAIERKKTTDTGNNLDELQENFAE